MHEYVHGSDVIADFLFLSQRKDFCLKANHYTFLRLIIEVSDELWFLSIFRAKLEKLEFIFLLLKYFFVV